MTISAAPLATYIWLGAALYVTIGIIVADFFAAQQRRQGISWDRGRGYPVIALLWPIFAVWAAYEVAKVFLSRK